MTLVGESRSGAVIAPAAEDTGDGWSKTAGNPQDGLIVQASGVTIRNLTIDGDANNLARGGTLANHHNFRHGIRTADGADYNNITVDSVNVYNIRRRGIVLFPTTGYAGTTVEENEFRLYGTGSGILLGRGSSGAPVPNQILHNVITSTNAASTRLGDSYGIASSDDPNFDLLGEEPLNTNNIISRNEITGFVRGIVLQDVNSYTVSATISGNHIYGNGIGIRFSGSGGGSVESNDFAGATENGIDIQILSTTGIVTIGNTATPDTRNIFAGGLFIDNQDEQSLLLTGYGADQLDGLDPGTLADNFDIEDRIHHRMDEDLAVTVGLVTWNTGQVYVTDPSEPGTTDSSIQRGVDAASSGNTVNVEAGLYDENVTIGKSVHLLGAGRDSTTIQPSATTGLNANHAILEIAVGKLSVSSATATIQGNLINDYQKGGILAAGSATNVTVGGTGPGEANTITGFDTGIDLFRYGVQTSGGRTVSATIGGSDPDDANTISGAATGILVDGGSANLLDNTITGNTFAGVDVDGGTAVLQGNNLTGNGIGLLIRGAAVVDAGQTGKPVQSNFTGLGVSTGGNDFSGYSGSSTSSGAIVDLNAVPPAGPQGVPSDATAFGNTWTNAAPSAIEQLIYHDPHNNALGFVDFANLGGLAYLDKPYTVFKSGWANEMMGNLDCTIGPRDGCVALPEKPVAKSPENCPNEKGHRDGGPWVGFGCR